MTPTYYTRINAYYAKPAGRKIMFDLRLLPEDNGCGCGIANPVGLWLILIAIAGLILNPHWVFLLMIIIGFILWSVI